MLDLEEQIERPLRGRLRQSRNAGHLRDVEEIFELVRLVDEEPVDAKFLERERVILFLVGGKRFELRLEPLLHALQFLDQPRAAIGCSARGLPFQFRGFAPR